MTLNCYKSEFFSRNVADLGSNISKTNEDRPAM